MKDWMCILPRKIESPVVLINHWHWLEANGYKKEAASCKRQASSLTRKNYNDIQEVKGERNENKRSTGNYRRQPEQTVKDAWLVNWSSCQRMQDWRQAQKVPGSVCFDCYALKGCYVFKVVQDAQYRRLAAIQSSATGLKQWLT
jgi:hypothetical protein